MFRYFTFFIGFRFIFGKTTDFFNKFISILSIISIALGISSLIIIISIMNGFEKHLENYILNFIPQVIITGNNGSINKKNNIKNNLLIPGVKKITSISISEAILQNTNNFSIGTIIGIDPKEQEPLEKYFLDVKKEHLKKNSYNAIIGKKLSYLLKIKKGDFLRIILPSNSKFTIFGKIPTQRLFKIIGFFQTNQEIDNYQIIINQQDASRMINYKNNYITGWRLYLDKPLEIYNLFNLKKEIIKKNFIWQDWQNIRGDFFQAITIEKKFMTILIILIILIAVFNIIIFIVLLIIEKKEAIIVLKIQGILKSKIIKIFILQGIILGSIGIFFGNIISIIFFYQINNILPIINNLFKVITLPIIIIPSQIIIINILTILTIILSIIYPSWYASSIKPIELLRNLS